ncbi:unnamed protein product [Protopolystoma xenopodis]|uniref:Uncharacterized protein n=1 Tax=Protopolystoma xenopodis TaxID=117903 RepID=A0A3S5AJM5_9PLAT|nr:unnamed protein product [Protopolystoma xenopodis]
MADFIARSRSPSLFLLASPEVQTYAGGWDPDANTFSRRERVDLRYMHAKNMLLSLPILRLPPFPCHYLALRQYLLCVFMVIGLTTFDWLSPSLL